MFTTGHKSDNIITPRRVAVPQVKNIYFIHFLYHIGQGKDAQTTNANIVLRTMADMDTEPGFEVVRDALDKKQGTRVCICNWKSLGQENLVTG